MQDKAREGLAHDSILTTSLEEVMFWGGSAMNQEGDADRPRSQVRCLNIYFSRRVNPRDYSGQYKVSSEALWAS